MSSTKRLRRSVMVTALAASLAACPEEGPRRIGASCTSDGQCASGLCAAGACVDPEGDDDGDTLVNRVEAALGTDPFAKDSDGDGVDDPVELGAVDAPSDGDGDGRIDAVESATGDSDDDCIVDQEDPWDSVSDTPSERFPEACGDGSVVCTGNPVAGTCAAPLGVMITDCFQPFGACQVTVAGQRDGATSITWASGAHMSWKSTGTVAVGQLVGPSGATCGTLRVTDPEAEDPESTLTVAGGGSYRIRSADDATVLTCPSGQEIVLHDSDSDAFAQCSGADAISRCTIIVPWTCTGDSDCEVGSRCCAVSREAGASRYCVPVESCPF